MAKKKKKKASSSIASEMLFDLLVKRVGNRTKARRQLADARRELREEVKDFHRRIHLGPVDEKFIEDYFF